MNAPGRGCGRSHRHGGLDRLDDPPQSSPMNPGGLQQRMKTLVHQALVHRALFD